MSQQLLDYFLQNSIFKVDGLQETAFPFQLLGFIKGGTYEKLTDHHDNHLASYIKKNIDLKKYK